MKPTILSSGQQPGEQASNPRPTAITVPGGAVKTQPTVVGAQVAKPTAIKPPDNIPAVTQVKPTAIVAPEKPKAVPTVSKPTGIAGGVQRQRIELSLTDLRNLNPGIGDGTLEKAMLLIQMTNLEALGDREVVMWGHNPQKSYGDLISQSLTIFQSEPLCRVQKHLSRMIEILSLIDLKKVCEQGASSALSKVFRKATKAIDTPEELAEAQTELSQLISLMNQEIDSLLKVKGQLEAISKMIDDIGSEIEVLAISAAYLADYIHRQNPTNQFYAKFLERSASLTQSLAQIRSSSSMRQVQIEHPLALISAVQSVALVQVPAWLGSIVSLKAMLERGKKPTVTEIDELSNQTQKVLEGLKGKA